LYSFEERTACSIRARHRFIIRASPKEKRVFVLLRRRRLRRLHVHFKSSLRKKQVKKDDFMMRHLHITLKAFEPNVLTKVSHTLHNVCKQLQSEKNRFFFFKRVGLPTLKKYLTVLRSPHVHKKSREQFVMHQYKTVLRMTSSLGGKQRMFHTPKDESHNSFSEQVCFSKSASKNALLKQRTLFACKHLTLSGVQLKQVIQYSSPLWCSRVS